MAQYVSTRLKGTVAVFSLEMSNESLLTRMICAQARVQALQLLQEGRILGADRRDLRFELTDETGQTVLIVPFAGGPAQRAAGAGPDGP